MIKYVIKYVTRQWKNSFELTIWGDDFRGVLAEAWNGHIVSAAGKQSGFPILTQSGP